MSPHIFNSLKSISMNIVSPGSRSAQYKLQQNNSETSDNNNNNSDSHLDCLIQVAKFDRLQQRRLKMQQMNVNQEKSPQNDDRQQQQPTTSPPVAQLAASSSRQDENDDFAERESSGLFASERVAGMPLLGRHRREQPPVSASSASASRASSGAAQGSGADAQQSGEPVCQSPMFGLRRQINLNKCELLINNQSSEQHQQQQQQQQSMTINSRQQIRASRSQASPSNQSNANQEQERHHHQQQQQCQELPQQITSQQIHYAFALMDSNGDGMIDLRDLSQMLANLGVPIDESVLSYIITTVSRRGDHRISESEFLEWLGQFVRVTEESDELARPASANSSGSARSAASSPTVSRRYRSGRARFRLAGGSSGSSLVAKSSNELPENFDKNGRRRGSVGSGLALMRSLSGSSIQSVSCSQDASTSKQATDKVQQQQQHQQQQQQLEHQNKPTSQQELMDEQEIRHDLRAAFCVFDLDGDGFITFEEVRAGLKLLGEAWTTAEMSRLFSSGRIQGLAGAGGNARSGSSNSNQQQATSNANDLSKQRISIDEFVRLLL